MTKPRPASSSSTKCSGTGFAEPKNCKQPHTGRRLGPELRARAEQAGLTWAERWFERVLHQRHVVAGGWPGTMSTRTRALDSCRQWYPGFASRAAGHCASYPISSSPLTVPYASAKAAWLRRTLRERSAGLVDDDQLVRNHKYPTQLPPTRPEASLASFLRSRVQTREILPS